MKAEAYKNYGDAALVSMVLEVLPHLAGEVSAIMMNMTMMNMTMIMMNSGGEPTEADPGDCPPWRGATREKPASEQPGQYLDVCQLGEGKVVCLTRRMVVSSSWPVAD